MKTIGFIDYFIDEWHANEYPNFIKAYNEKNGTDFVVKYVWAETNNPNGITTEKWCEKYGAIKCDSIKELCKKADFIMLLAPSNPEKHLEYAKQMFECKRGGYIDKTFAPDYETAVKIFELAKENGVEFFTSSALRYATELDEYAGKAKTLFVMGSGGNYEEYIIHMIEMTVKMMGFGASSVKYNGYNDQRWLDINYADGRHAKILQSPFFPFAFSATIEGKNTEFITVNSPFFDNLIADVLRYFEEGTLSFNPEETLEVMRLRGYAIKATKTPNVEIEIL
ncbi:MAG: hypothetical protein IKL82_05140 [Clostridia bacterium]|nr:hypothetical protein [Clostridia bacterium]